MDRRSFLQAFLAAGLVPPALHPFLPGDARSASGSSPLTPRTRPTLEALVLGSVQDAGLPQVGCYTPRCEAAREAHREGRGRYVASMALIEPAAARFWLVDATPDITRQIDLIAHPAFRERARARRPFDGIFLTHAHIGHYTGLAVLGNEGLGIADTPVYCTSAMARFLRENAPWALMVEQGRIVPTPLEPGRWRRIDPALDVRPLRVPHRDEYGDTVGFLFRGPERSLLYLPDIDGWDDWERDVAEVVAATDVALLDASFWSADELPGRALEDIPHPLVTDTMERLQRVVDRGEAEVVLTHMNNSNPLLDDDGPERRETLRRGFAVAREGMRFPL